ncbi:MAG: hypothetical protein AB7I18_08760 [Candidatus Berkiella sp.]
MKSNQTKLSLLSTDMLSDIHGGISLGAIALLIEIPHGLLIARETTNYIAKLWIEGCDGVDEHDYFTKFFCGGKS